MIFRRIAAEGRILRLTADLYASALTGRNSSANTPGAMDSVCACTQQQEFVGEHSRCDGRSVQLRAAPARRVRKADAFVMRRRFTGACPATLKLL